MLGVFAAVFAAGLVQVMGCLRIFMASLKGRFDGRLI